MTTPEDICPDFPEWPERWMGVEEDRAYGRGLLEALRPFIEDLIAGGWKRRTLRNHMDNLWMLGGHIIRNVGMEDAYDTPPSLTLREAVGPDGGPLCRHLDTEAEVASFDATCRKLHKFLSPST